MENNEYSKLLEKAESQPVGIKVISIINYVLASFVFVLGLFTIYGGYYFIKNGHSFGNQIFGGVFGSSLSQFYTSSGYLFLLFGIFSIILCLLLIIIGINLWKGKRWAKVGEIVLSFLWVLLWSLELFKGAYLNIIFVIPGLIILIYLLFRFKF